MSYITWGSGIALVVLFFWIRWKKSRPMLERPSIRMHQSSDLTPLVGFALRRKRRIW